MTQLFARKQTRISLKTGEVISEKILGPIETTKEEYWGPVVRVMGPIVLEAIKNDMKIAN